MKTLDIRADAKGESTWRAGLLKLERGFIRLPDFALEAQLSHISPLTVEHADTLYTRLVPAHGGHLHHSQYRSLYKHNNDNTAININIMGYYMLLFLDPDSVSK